MMAYHKLTFAGRAFVGSGATVELSSEVNQYHVQRLLVVTDPTLVSIGLVNRILESLDDRIQIELYSDVEPEPPLSCAARLVQHVRCNRYDLIIGVGGGSAIDLAKLAGALANEAYPVESYLNLTGQRKPTAPKVPTIVVPTTAGTGSECTNIAVLALDTTKDVVADDALLPNCAIVDPVWTLSLPPRVTAATGVDALTHAIEAYVSKGASPASDALALQAIRMMSRSIVRAVQDGAHLEARADMSIGSYLAGLAFFNAGVAGVHALAYPLGGLFHIPHGESNAVLLPYVMGYIRSSCSKRYEDMLAVSAFASKEPIFHVEPSKFFVQALQQMVKEVNIPTTLEGFGISFEAIAGLTDDAVLQTRLLARSPMQLKREEIQTIYEAAWQGQITEPN